MNDNTDEPILMDGRQFSHEYGEKILAPRSKEFKEQYGRQPKLATVMVGEDPASESYLRIKEKYFATVGHRRIRQGYGNTSQRLQLYFGRLL